MSDFFEKTFVSVNNILHNVHIFGSSAINLPAYSDSDRFSFIKKSLSAPCKKVEEEDVKKFLTAAEKRLAQPNVPNPEIEIYIHSAIFCETLGYPAPFIYVHALKLAQKGNLQQKKTGYLGCATFLHPRHELVILLINTIQKDLVSSNYAEVKLALTAICDLISVETVHDVLYLVQEKLNHERASIRKLAVLTLNHCLEVANSPSACQMAVPKLEKALSDADLSVVYAAVTALFNIVKETPTDYRYLVPGLIQLQNQLLPCTISSDFTYHGTPSPWLQINILKLFALLGNDAQLSNELFPVLKSTLQKAEVNNNAAYAIISECTETISAIKYSEEMIQLALCSTSKLLKSDSANLKFMGVKALVTLVKKIQPTLALAQQDCIMECLKHPDKTLQIKTLELLYYLANPSNAEPICKRMVHFMTSIKDGFIRKDLVSKTLSLANKYNERKVWYITIINSVILEAGEIITAAQISEIINAFEKDSSGSLKNFAKDVYLEMYREKKLLPTMIPVVAFVLGESSKYQVELCELLKEASADSRVWLLSSLQDTILKSKIVPDNLLEILKELKCETYILRQKRSELLHVIESLADLDLHDSDEEYDPTLSFLDDYVCQFLASGSPCYVPQSLRTETKFSDVTGNGVSKEESSNSDASLPLSLQTSSLGKSPLYNSLSSAGLSVLSSSSSKENERGVQKTEVPKKKNVWTVKGRLKDLSSTEEDSEKLPNKKNSEEIQSQTTVSKSEDLFLFAGLSSTADDSVKSEES